MKLTIKETVSFELPREFEAYEEFKTRPDIEFWKETLTREKAYFTQQTEVCNNH